MNVEIGTEAPIFLIWEYLFQIFGILSLKCSPVLYVEKSGRDRICKPYKEPMNRFPAWRAGTTTLFDVPARQAT
jgi:hypothetical protein